MQFCEELVAQLRNAGSPVVAQKTEELLKRMQEYQPPMRATVKEQLEKMFDILSLIQARVALEKIDLTSNLPSPLKIGLVSIPESMECSDVEKDLTKVFGELGGAWQHWTPHCKHNGLTDWERCTKQVAITLYWTNE